METERKLDVLADIARALNQSGVTWAVGGSLLLYFKGKTGVFRDIDLMVCETDVEKLKQAMLPLGALSLLLGMLVSAAMTTILTGTYFWTVSGQGINRFLPMIGSFLAGDILPPRSEERRGGEECRSRWAPDP